MFVTRNGFDADMSTLIGKPDSTCVGCKDCAGACLELMELTVLPDLLMRLRETRS